MRASRKHRSVFALASTEPMLAVMIFGNGQNASRECNTQKTISFFRVFLSPTATRPAQNARGRKQGRYLVKAYSLLIQEALGSPGCKSLDVQLARLFASLNLDLQTALNPFNPEGCAN